MQNKTYELSLVKTYVSHWGILEAIRELIQNALDSDSPFVYDFKVDEKGFSELILNSEYSVLTPQTLLLGSTSKANGESIGSFGEGYKIAMLVLTRLDIPVEILNGSVKWTPMFKFNEHFGEELLVIEETTIEGNTNKGLTFCVKGLTDSDVEDIKNSCLRMQDNIGAIKQTFYGDILLDKPRQLYVGGLFVCETDTEYGYNVIPKYLRLERDRQTVDGWDLSMLTKDMWFETQDYDMIAELMEADVVDLRRAEWGCPELVKEACYKRFREKHPDAVIANNNDEVQELVERGLTVYVGGNVFASAVLSSDKYEAEGNNYKEVLTPNQIMVQFFKDNKSEMRTKALVAFKKVLSQSSQWKIK